MQYVSNKGGNAEHEYRTLNGKVVYEKIGSGSTAKIMIFSYDAQGRPFAVKYSTNNGASFINYFYALNQQGDVVKIFRPMPVKDSDGNLIGRTEKVYATYTYDAWGKLIGITDRNGDSLMNKQATSSALANRNPLRYRGYYYDVETGFYYLQSRYYDPANHRFINADVYASTDSGDAVSCNMFAYCGNNPVMSSDEEGRLFGLACMIVAACALVGAGLGALDASATGGDIVEGAVEGFVNGGIGAICGLCVANPFVAVATATLGGMAVDFTTQAASQYIKTDNVDFSKIDYRRVVKTGIQTGVGTAIPSFAEGARNAVDAFGTALIWTEGSTLVTCTDIIYEHTANNNASRRNSNKQHKNSTAKDIAITSRFLF